MPQEDIDLADHDEEGTYSRAIFNNAWDDLKGEEVECPHCDQWFEIEEVVEERSSSTLKRPATKCAHFGWKRRPAGSWAYCKKKIDWIDGPPGAETCKKWE